MYSSLRRGVEEGGGKEEEEEEKKNASFPERPRNAVVYAYSLCAGCVPPAE